MVQHSRPREHSAAITATIVLRKIFGHDVRALCRLLPLSWGAGARRTASWKIAPTSRRACPPRLASGDAGPTPRSSLLLFSLTRCLLATSPKSEYRRRGRLRPRCSRRRHRRRPRRRNRRRWATPRRCCWSPQSSCPARLHRNPLRVCALVVLVEETRARREGGARRKRRKRGGGPTRRRSGKRWCTARSRRRRTRWWAAAAAALAAAAAEPATSASSTSRRRPELC